MTKTLNKNWQDIELDFTTTRISTLDDLARLDPDRNGWNMVSLKIWCSGFTGKTETGNLLGLLLDFEGLSYDTQGDWVTLVHGGTIDRLTDLIDQHLVPKGRRA